MMVDNTENNEFRELLSDYAQPISDDGFSEHVLMQANKPKNAALIKNLMVGGAALMAAFIAVPQLDKLIHLLGQLVGSVKLPELSVPRNFLETASMPSMTIIALLAVLIVGVASTFLFSSDL